MNDTPGDPMFYVCEACEGLSKMKCHTTSLPALTSAYPGPVTYNCTDMAIP